MNGNRCPVCGKPLVYVPSHGRYVCDVCNISVPGAGTAPEQPQQRQWQSYPQPQPPSPDQMAENAKRRMYDAIAEREMTDRVMSPWWAAIYLVFVASYFVLILTFVLVAPSESGIWYVCTIIGLIWVVYMVLYIVLVYRLLKRRQAHFQRDAIFRYALIEYLRAKAWEKQVNIDGELSTMMWIDSNTRMSEPDREAPIWTILTVIIPFVNLYVFYFLTKDPLTHHWNQDAFYRQLSSAFHKLGNKQFITPGWLPLPNRSPVLYLVLSIFIFPFFIYWIYAIITDTNRHFMMQWEVEDYIWYAVRGD